MTFRSFFLSGAVCAAIVVLAVPLEAQTADTRALMDRIERLERDIRTLNVQIARGGTPAAASGTTGASPASSEPAFARLSVRMAQLENDLRGVTGRIEEMTFQMNQIAQQMEKLVTDVDFRLSQLEKADAMGAGNTASLAQPQTNNALPSSLPTPAAPASNGTQVLGTLSQSDVVAAATAQPANTATPAPAAPASEADALLAQLTGEAPDASSQVAAQPVAPTPQAAPSPAGVSVASSPTQAAPQTLAAPQTAALPDGTPRDKYMHAFGLLRQGKYDLASSALQNFIQDHGDDKLASNARYWLGETYYVRGAFVEAAETFLEGFQSDPQGPKAPDALLKLGMSLSSLDKKSEACAAFQKLRSDYPDAPAGLKSTLQRESQKNGCV